MVQLIFQNYYGYGYGGFKDILNYTTFLEDFRLYIFGEGYIIRLLAIFSDFTIC